MAKNKRIQFEFYRGSAAIKIIAAVAIVLTILALTALRWRQNKLQADTDALRSQAAELEHENQELQDKIDNIDSVDGVKEAAEDELGLVDPDTVIIEPNK